MPQTRAATLKDVAQRAGTQITSASVVLNGNRSNTRVSEATRQRILMAARELDYQPNAIARSLLQRKTNAIGLYQGTSNADTHDPFYAAIIRGLQLGCREHRKDLLLHTAYEDRDANEIYAELVNGKVDGLILLMQPNGPLIDRLAASRFPVVAVADPVPSLPCVVAGDVEGSRLQARHLYEKGHRLVMYLTVENPHASAKRRLIAFREETARLGMTVFEGLAPIDRVVLGEREKAWLTGPISKRPTAAACWNDYCAHSLMYILVCMEIRVPDDLAVIGFDGFDVVQRPEYYLTTIHANWTEVAKVSVGLLTAMEAGDVPSETVLPVEFRAGNTT